MLFVLMVFFVVMAWTAGMFEWMVSYATSIVQLGVWITLRSLVSGWSFWMVLKRQPFTELQKSNMHAHWSINVKI